MKYLIAGLFLLGLFIAAFFGVGYFAPPNHHAEAVVYIKAPRAVVWDVLTDFEGLPNRKIEIRKVEQIGKTRYGLPIWKEYTDLNGYFVYEIQRFIPQRQLKLKLSSSAIGLKGTWLYQLREVSSNTEITVIENSELQNRWVRSIFTLAGRDSTLYRNLHILKIASDAQFSEIKAQENDPKINSLLQSESTP